MASYVQCCVPHHRGAVQEVLAPYRSSGAVAVNWRCFSSSGHMTRPAAGVLRSYSQCYPAEADNNRHAAPGVLHTGAAGSTGQRRVCCRHIKSIVRLPRAMAPLGRAFPPLVLHAASAKPCNAERVLLQQPTTFSIVRRTLPWTQPSGGWTAP